MRFYRENPDSNENNHATRENSRAVFAAQMSAKQHEWKVKYHLKNSAWETQSIGVKYFDHEPTTDDIESLRQQLLKDNVWAASLLIVS